MPPRFRLLLALATAAALLLAAAAFRPAEGPQPRALAHVTLEPGTAVPRARSGRPPKQVRSLARKAKPRTPAPVRNGGAVVPNDPLWPASWSLAKVGAPEAWRVTTGATDVVVAVVDTGIDSDHPDLQGALVPGWNVIAGNADADDDHGHGTAVAGVIAARGNNGTGGAGACWRCSLMPVKVIASSGTGSASDIAQGIVWAADHGADVINLSFVLSGYDGAVAGAIDYARARGALVVAAAGNSGGNDVSFPASHPGVISVSATDSADVRYAWASYGGWVTLAAPGCSQSTFPGGVYGEFCGTSSATAFLSGVAGLVRSLAGVDAALAYSALAGNAARVGDFVASGRVDAAAAVAARPRVSATPPPGDSPPDPHGPRRDPL